MKTFVVPIEGLTSVARWDVGPVAIRPATDVLEEFRRGAEAHPESSWFFDVIDEIKSGAFAEVDAPAFDDALVLVTQAVDVLRVFQHARHYTTQLTQFGIVGDVQRAVVPYAVANEGRAAFGFKHRGHALGWTFSEPRQWEQAGVFRWVANAIGASAQSEAQRRALVGVQLLSQALIERRPTLKMVQLVTALEAWLLPRRGRAQTFQLARAVAFFGCGRSNGDLCGRSRDTCPYLACDPGKQADLEMLKRLRKRGAAPLWRCSEWHRVVDWYDDRSDVVHGAGPVISPRDSSSALYWTLRWLAEPILEFLRDHEVDPIESLDAALRGLPEPPDWEARLGPL